MIHIKFTFHYELIITFLKYLELLIGVGFTFHYELIITLIYSVLHVDGARIYISL